MDAFLDLSLDEDLQTCFQAIDRNNDPKAQKHILGSQYTVIGTSDGGGRPHTADRHETSTHLLGHWVREQQAMTLEEAVYRLTGKTALMHDITRSRLYRRRQGRRHHDLRPRHDRLEAARAGRDLPAGGVAGQARRGRHRLCRRQRPGAARQGRADRRAARPDHPRPALPGARIVLCLSDGRGNPAITLSMPVISPPPARRRAISPGALDRRALAAHRQTARSLPPRGMRQFLR